MYQFRLVSMGVARGAGDSLTMTRAAEYCVYEHRLADVRAADDGDARAVGSSRVVVLREQLHHFVHSAHFTSCMR